MGLFSKFNKKSSPAVVGGANTTFFPLDFVQQFISNSLELTDDKILKYYLSVPELAAIVNYRARVFADMKVKARKLSSGEDVDVPIMEMMKSPNPYQTFRELAQQYSITKDLYGNAYLHPVYAFDRQKSKALYNLPAANAEIEFMDGAAPNPFNLTDYSDYVKRYKFKFQGGLIHYNPDEIIHYNDNSVKYEKDKWLKGISRVTQLSQVCENIKTAYEVRGIIQGNSPLGMITNQSTDGMGTVPLLPEDKENIQNELKKYGATKKKYQFIVTSASLRYVSMATSVANLKLFDEVDDDQSAIADAFNFPVELFQNNVTYENKKEAKKLLYQDSTIPEAKVWLDGLNKFFGFNDIELYPDYSHVSVLQEDLERKAKMWNWTVTALSKALADGAMTSEEYRINLEKIGLL